MAGARAARRGRRPQRSGEDRTRAGLKKKNQQTVTRLNMMWNHLNGIDLADRLSERQDAVNLVTSGQMIEIQGEIGKQRARGFFEGILGKDDSPDLVLSWSEFAGELEGSIYQTTVYGLGSIGNLFVSAVETVTVGSGKLYVLADGGVNLGGQNYTVRNFERKIESLMVENEK